MTSTNSPNGWNGLPASSRRIALQLLRHGPASRSELAAELGLSPASLTRMVGPLLQAGLVVEGEPRMGESLGRPSIPLEAVVDSSILIGVSITHQQVVVVATDLRSEVLTSRTEVLTDLSVGPVVDVVARLVAELRSALEAKPILAVGVCVGGNVADGRTVCHAPFLGWECEPLADLLEDATGLPVRLENDLAALARAELWFGLGLEADRFIVVTVGVGVGYALVIDRRVIVDADFGYGAVTGPIMGQGWPDFAHPESLAGERADDAARRLGRLIGTAAAVTMPQQVRVAGESAFVLVGHEKALHGGIREVRHARAGDLDVRLHETDFAFWARGAATQAISWVAGVEG